MISERTTMTADELLTYDAGAQRTELIRGQLVVREPVGGPHASVLLELSLAIGLHVRATQPVAGHVLIGDPGFWLAHSPDTVRAPDLAFVSLDRFPGGIIADGFLRQMPDLAAEIRSPSDRTGELLQKVGQWLDVGCALVWVIDPAKRTAQVYRPDGGVALLSADDVLDGDPVLPGLHIVLSTLWRGT